MYPIRSIDEVLANWSIFEKKWRTVYAFFLYSDEDRQIVKYIREYFTDLDNLSGGKCLIFLIEKPPKNSEEVEEIKNYWKGYKFKRGTCRYCFEEVMPYNRAKSYEIADFFGISPKAIPCIVFFKSIDETDLIVFPLKNTWNEDKLCVKLREVFSAMNMDNEHTYPEYMRVEIIWHNLRKYVMNEYRETKMIGIITHPITINIGQTFRKIFLHC